MSLELAKQALKMGGIDLNLDAWVADEEKRGDRVALFRQYAEGDHRANLTPEMRKTLNIKDNAVLSEFNDNYVPIIIDTMSDRIKLSGIEADNDSATEWAQDIQTQNRLDALQIDIHEATVRDGNTYLLADAVEEDGERRIRWTHEPAYDGTSGMVVLYEHPMAKQPIAAVKIWKISRQTTGDTTRVNVYKADRIERYISLGGTSLAGFVEVTEEGETIPEVMPWTVTGQEGGEPIGLPVIHFRNRGSSHDNYGVSAIQDVIPLQDALNRTMYSMVATAEQAGFPIRWVKGAAAPDGVTPGMFIDFIPKDDDGNIVPPSADGIDWLNAIQVGVLESSQIAQFIEQAQWIKSEIFRITNTPDDEDSASTASGESLKQREVKLLGKIERFQTKNGNAWEDVLTVSHRIARAFVRGTPPQVEQFNALWKDAQLRNDTQLIDNALKLFNANVINQRHLLELVAEVFGFDEKKIEQIILDTTGPDAIPEDAEPEDDLTPEERVRLQGRFEEIMNGNQPQPEEMMDNGDLIPA